jgi:hypothetical protein
MTRQGPRLMALGIGMALAISVAPYLLASSTRNSVSRNEAASIIGAGDLCSDYRDWKCGQPDDESSPDPGCNLEACKQPTGPNPNGTAPDSAPEDWCGDENSPCGRISHNQDPCDEESPKTNPL